MITVALDTSTARGAVALLREEQPLAEEVFQRAEHCSRATQNLFSAIDTLLAREKLTPQAIGLIAVGTGPGSFTGIRAGIAAAKGLALARALPIKAVSSFDALALTAQSRLPPDCVQLCVVADARRDEIYYAIYDANGQRETPIRIGTFEEIAFGLRNPIWFVSAEIEKFRASIAEAFGGFGSVCEPALFPSAAALGWLAVRQFRASGNVGDQQLEPIYLREPQYRKR
jgi:tRNA threonylcarbamoyladenosine biosynthesis protein TsaB